jgi:RNA exonuclease 1
MAPITPTEDYLACLSSLMEPAEVLEKHGFISKQLEDEELLLKRRCAGCGKRETRSLER